MQTAGKIAASRIAGPSPHAALNPLDPAGRFPPGSSRFGVQRSAGPASRDRPASHAQLSLLAVRCVSQLTPCELVDQLDFGREEVSELFRPSLAEPNLMSHVVRTVNAEIHLDQSRFR